MTGRSLDEWLRERAADRDRRGLHRELTPRTPGGDVVDLAGNDYLGLARDPDVVAAAIDAVRTWGTGATGSRLVTGTTTLHGQLEDELATFLHVPAALVFASGYAANLAVVSALTDDDTLIVSDAGNHASLIDGCRLSRAAVVVTPHRDPEAVAGALARRSQSRAFVVTDAVFSVDGELAPIVDLYDVCVRYGATLVVDEAHALGVAGPDGRGVVSAAGLAAQPDVIRTVTLSKSLGAQGGAVLATPHVVAHLVDTARTFIFDTGLAPASAAAALQALRTVIARPQLVGAVRDRAASLARGLGLALPDAAIVSMPIEDPVAAVGAARHCRERGVWVGCFRPPSVPDGMSRLRMTARADLSAADIARAVDAVRAATVQPV